MGAAVSFVDDLAAMDAPPDVLEAGRRIEQFITAKVKPPRDLVEFVVSWVGRANQQDRYGK